MTAATQPLTPADDSRPTGPPRQPPATSAPTGRSSRAAHLFGGLARISLGWVFLWAFVDKMFGLGYATESTDAWINGGSPTFGFLSFGATGPFKGTYNSIAGATWADWLFMLGLLAIGVALVLGVLMNLAAGAGALLLVLMWTAVLPPENNPFMDDHLVYALTLGLLASLGAGSWIGLGDRWTQTSWVRRVPALR